MLSLNWRRHAKRRNRHAIEMEKKYTKEESSFRMRFRISYF